jgi:septal ring factor EnvC (AmiA/AmiB activator)
VERIMANSPPHDHLPSDVSDQIRELLRHELQAMVSLRKNGGTWGDYVTKIVTPERIMLVVLLVYQFGGQVQQIKQQLEYVTARDQEVTAQQEELTQQLAAARSLFTAQEETVLELMAHTDTLRTTTAGLDDRINRTVTRAEFKEALDQRILPRLERIERRMDDQ